MLIGGLFKPYRVTFNRDRDAYFSNAFSAGSPNVFSRCSQFLSEKSSFSFQRVRVGDGFHHGHSTDLVTVQCVSTPRYIGVIYLTDPVPTGSALIVEHSV